MRIVVTGATGNVGSAVVRALTREPRVTEVVGVARRADGMPSEGRVHYVAADVRDRAAIAGVLEGADAVVHLAWAIQPARDREHTRSVNVAGSHVVFAAAAAVGVPVVVHASSVGAYGPAPDREPRDESWPATGITSSFYSRDKADAERALDDVLSGAPRMRAVRLRPGLIFQRGAAEEIRRLFAGPLLPGAILRRGLLPVVPHIPAVRFQAVHADDVAEAYRLALLDDDAHGAYNVAAEPLLTTATLAEMLGARKLPVPYAVARGAAAATWRAHVQPTPPGWLDLAARAPVLDCSRIRDELGWRPQRDGRQALEELLDGLRRGDGADTPPLRPGAGGPARLREVLTGIGSRG